MAEWRVPTEDDDEGAVVLVPLIGPHACNDDHEPCAEGLADLSLAASAPRLREALRQVLRTGSINGSTRQGLQVVHDIARKALNADSGKEER